MDAKELRANLSQFTGTMSYYSLGPLFKHAMLTDGVHFLVEEAACLWLVTDAAAWVVQKVPGENFDEGFIGCKFTPNADGSAVMTLSDGNYNELFRQEYQNTTFPLPEGVEFWFEWGEGSHGPCWIALLPMEH